MAGDVPETCTASASHRRTILDNVLQSLPPRPFGDLFEIACAVPQLLDRHPSFGPLGRTLNCVARLDRESCPAKYFEGPTTSDDSKP